MKRSKDVSLAAGTIVGSVVFAVLGFVARMSWSELTKKAGDFLTLYTNFTVFYTQVVQWSGFPKRVGVILENDSTISYSSASMIQQNRDSTKHRFDRDLLPRDKRHH